MADGDVEAEGAKGYEGSEVEGGIAVGCINDGVLVLYVGYKGQGTYVWSGHPRLRG